MGQPKLSKLSLWGEANAWAEARAYRHPHSGIKYPSVTSILRMADKSGLISWATKLTAEWCANNVDKLLSTSVEKGIRIAQYRYKDVRDERAEVGTGVHESIEAQLTGSWDFPVLDHEQELIMDEWRAFLAENEFELMLSEFTVFDSESRSMGTADLYAMVNGKRTLIDLKTSRNMWPEHDYQLAALWHAEDWLIETEEMIWTRVPRREVDQVAILHLRAPEYDEYGRMTRPGKHELHVVEDLEENYAVYKAYSDVWYGKDALSKLKKKREVVTVSGF